MIFHRLVLVAVIAGLCATPAQAQDYRHYVAGEAGGSFGDGGSAPALAAGFGFLYSRRIGVELEVSYIPNLDFVDRTGSDVPFLPPIDIEATGRIVGLQTHVVGILPGGGTKLQVFVTGGGGVADVQQRVRLSLRDFLGGFPPGFPPSLPPGSFPPGFPGVPDLSAFFLFPSEIEETQSDASLVLSGGAGFEYAVSRRLGLGVVARYQRVFTNPSAIDMARVGLRARLKF